MTLVDDVLQRVRVHVAQRRLRLDDFFTDFDALRTGRITGEQFRRALAVNNVHLSDEEYEAMKEFFAASSKSCGAFNKIHPEGAPMDVSYVSFLKAVRAKNPPADLLTTLRRKAKMLSDEEERVLEEATNSLRHFAKVRGIDLRKAFEDFDPFHSGKVNPSQFRRCIPFEAMREDLLKLIIQKYSNEDGNVLYAAWCKDLDCDTVSSRVGAQLATTLSDPSHSNAREPLSLDELLSVLRSQFALYRLRCDDFLRSCDHFRTGYVTGPQFESALGQLRFVNFHLTTEHIDTLIRAYSDARLGGVGEGCNKEAFPRVNYVQFLADTNPYSGGAAQGSTTYYEMSRAGGKFFDNDEEEERERAEAVVKKVRQLVLSNRINLKPILHDFDRVKKGIYEHRTCTESRFLRSLASNKIFLNPEEIALLVKRYRICNADGSPSEEVNYYQFVLDVDGANKIEPNPLRLLKSTALEEMRKKSENSRLSPADSVPAILAKVAMQAEERQLRVNEFFIDFDPLRSGIVQTEKFVIALGIAGLKLHPQEVALLQAEYKSSKARDHIDVARFLTDVGNIAPTAVPSVTTRFNITELGSSKGRNAALAAEILKNTTRTSTVMLKDTEHAELARLLARLSHDVAAHHTLLTPFFSDFDHPHRGKISRSNFLRALAQHRFVLSPAEAILLSRYYASPDDSELIQYTRFVRDVGHEETTLGSHLGNTADLVSSVNGGTMNATPFTGKKNFFLRDAAANESLVECSLTKICCFLQERNARLSEFFPDGDELRHGHVTNTRFRHCVSILGLNLTENELQALEAAFAHHELKGHVDYPTFFSVVSEKLKAGVGVMAVTQRRCGLPTVADFTGGTGGGVTALRGDLRTETGGSAKSFDDVQAKVYEMAMDKVRRTLTSRRTTSLSAFRQYDRARKGFVKEGQFFATLMSLGVQLSPEQSDAIRKVHSIGGGEIGYTRFSHAIDDQRFV